MYLSNYKSNYDRIELHYLLENGVHSMNALVRNSAEKELLLIIERITTELEVEIDIESYPFEEGGLREFFKIIEKKGKKNPFLSGIIATVLIAVLTNHATKDFEKDKLEKEKIKLETEKIKLEIKKLNENLENDQKNETSEYLIRQSIVIFNSDIKVVKHKSNFYSKLNQYPKVKSIETSSYNNEYDAYETYTVDKVDFDKFILQTDELEPDFNESAIIEIISPVLKKGNYKWRGIYLETNEPISFYMKDSEFKQHVVSDSIPFQNGSQIVCELEIERRINEIGEIENHSYSVKLVQEVLNANQRFVTKHSKRIKREREELRNQITLDFGEDN